jgi:imidazolonepropionase-like amidohydrolase
MKTFAGLVALCALIAATTRALADTVVVTADRMLDVIAGRVVDQPQITITDGRITAVASVTAAEALRRPGDVGAIAVGRFGDMIAVAGDPLADVAILQSVAFVMKGGEVVKQPAR